MLTSILALVVIVLGGVALYGAGRSDGYRAGCRDAEENCDPEVYQPHPDKGEHHGDAHDSCHR